MKSSTWGAVAMAAWVVMAVPLLILGIATFALWAGPVLDCGSDGVQLGGNIVPVSGAAVCEGSPQGAALGYGDVLVAVAWPLTAAGLALVALVARWLGSVVRDLNVVRGALLPTLAAALAVPGSLLVSAVLNRLGCAPQALSRTFSLQGPYAELGSWSTSCGAGRSGALHLSFFAWAALAASAVIASALIIQHVAAMRAMRATRAPTARTGRAGAIGPIPRRGLMPWIASAVGLTLLGNLWGSYDPIPRCSDLGMFAWWQGPGGGVCVIGVPGGAAKSAVEVGFVVSTGGAMVAAVFVLVAFIAIVRSYLISGRLALAWIAVAMLITPVGHWWDVGDNSESCRFGNLVGSGVTTQELGKVDLVSTVCRVDGPAGPTDVTMVGPDRLVTSSLAALAAVGIVVVSAATRRQRRTSAKTGTGAGHSPE